MRKPAGTVRPLTGITGSLVLAGALLLAVISAPTGSGSAFPGKPGSIVYAHHDGNDYEIYTLGPGGGTPVHLTDNSGDDEHPGYSPDGKRIVYSSDSGGDLEIRIRNLLGSGGDAPVTENALYDAAPTFSADGNRIFFVRDTGPEVEIYAINPDGSVEDPLTATDGVDEWDPAASPNGKLVAYEAATGTDDIYLMNADGSGEHRVLAGTATISWHTPSFSADSRRLAVARQVSGPNTSDIYVLNLATGKLTNATPGTGDYDEFPAFAPDSARVAFSREGELVTSALDGSGPQTLTTGGQTYDPDWQPIPVRCGGKTATLVGTARRDVLKGTSRRDVIAALAGNDIAKGLGGNDVLCGAGGRDRLLGGDGRDKLLGGGGRDRLLGGKGRDRQRQ